MEGNNLQSIFSDQRTEIRDYGASGLRAGQAAPRKEEPLVIDCLEREGSLHEDAPRCGA